MTRKEIVLKWYSGIDSKDFDETKALMADNHEFYNPMSPVQNRDEHIGMMQMMTSALEGNHIADHMIEEGEWVAVQGRWSGIHIGEFNGIPATGNKVEFTILNHFQIIEDKVIKEYLEMNPMAIMVQIGAIETA